MGIMDTLKLLFAAPEIDPVTRKAKSIPILNPIDPYGRVFFFSWFGFLVAFLSWYAFPPLVSSTSRLAQRLGSKLPFFFFFFFFFFY